MLYNSPYNLSQYLPVSLWLRDSLAGGGLIGWMPLVSAHPEILRACDAIRFEALESFVEVHRPGEMDHVCDGAADLTVIAIVEPKVRVAKVRWQRHDLGPH